MHRSSLEHEPWKPFSESLRTTLVRTITIALLVGAAMAWFTRRFAYWPLASLLVLWLALGGHFVELWFLNRLRPALPAARVVQIAARLAVWMVGGTALAVGVTLTATIAGRPPPIWAAWWLGGFVFIGVELVVHMFMWMLKVPNFYNGRG